MSKSNIFKKTFLLLPVAMVIGCGPGIDEIHKKVANDAVSQYNLSVRGGDQIEICVHAGLVVAAYSHALDEMNYLKWKEIQKVDCRKAGM